MVTSTAVAAPAYRAARLVNLRIPLFASIALLVVGWPVYSYVSEAWTGGIHDRGAYKEVDLKAMGYFRLDPYSPSIRDVPARYRRLDGQKVLLTGLIQPHAQAGENISEFTLVYSEVSCCVGSGPPLVQEQVHSTARAGARLRYRKPGYYHVLGTLHVAVRTDESNGVATEVYAMDVDSIEPIK
jgi:hypothetical protein